MTYDPREWDWDRVIPEFVRDGRVLGGPSWPDQSEQWYSLSMLVFIALTLGHIAWLMFRRAIEWGFLSRFMFIAFASLSFWTTYSVVRAIFPQIKDTDITTLLIRTTVVIPLVLLNIALRSYRWPTPAPDRIMFREFFGFKGSGSTAKTIDPAVPFYALAAHIAQVTTNSAGIIRAVSPAATELTGYEPGELIGQNVTILMPKEYRDRHTQGLKRFIETGESRIIGTGVPVELLNRDGDKVPIYLMLVAADDRGSLWFIGTMWRRGDESAVLA